MPDAVNLLYTGYVLLPYVSEGVRYACTSTANARPALSGPPITSCRCCVINLARQPIGCVELTVSPPCRSREAMKSSIFWAESSVFVPCAYPRAFAADPSTHTHARGNGCTGTRTYRISVMMHKHERRAAGRRTIIGKEAENS